MKVFDGFLRVGSHHKRVFDTVDECDLSNRRERESDF